MPAYRRHTSSIHRLHRLMLLLACLLVLQGCAVTLLYRQLDWLIPWYVDDYLALDARQEKRFERLLDDYLVWHRDTQLPAYATFLRGIAKQAGNGLDEAELAAIQEGTEILTRDLISAMGPPLADLLADASDAQVAHLMNKFAEDNRRYREERIEIPEAEARADAVEDVIRGIERWVGPLDRRQRAMVEEWGARYRPMAGEWLSARQRWQQAFAQVLEKRREHPEAFREGLLALMDNTRLGRSPAFEAAIAHNHQELLLLQHRLDHSLSSRQREKLVKRLLDHADEFEALADG